MVEFLEHPVSLEAEAETSLQVGDPRPIQFAVQPPNHNQFDLWIGPLDLSSSRLAEFETTLTPHELDRAYRFRLEEHQHRYIAAHGWLRSVLAGYLAQSPDALEFVLTPKGKPSLSPSSNQSGLRFNLAHSENLAAIAICKDCDVGVDIEKVRAIPDAGDLVRRFFSHNESVTFNSLPEDQRPAAFFNLWTRKEAWLKATGEGIAHMLNQVEVSFLPGDPVRLLNLPAGYGGELAWSLHAINPRPDIVVAVAAKCVQLQLRTLRAENFSEDGS